MPGTLLLISFLPPGLTISILALLGGFLAFIVLVNAAQVLGNFGPILA
jgi:xanthine/uracil/vitamin C permease (AzgA family)